MKPFWNWLRGLFGHKPKAVPAPEPKPPVRQPVAPASGGTLPSAPAPAPQPNPAPPVVTPVPIPVSPDPVPVAAPAGPIAVPVAPVAPAPPVASSPLPVAPSAPAPVSPIGPPSPPQQPQPGPVQPAPTFTDDFSAGKLDLSKWIPSNWNAPGNISGVHQGTFSSDALDFSHGCLRIKVSQKQDPNAGITSQGGELQSRQTFGFGTYEWILRASSTSETPEGSGKPVSGQISSGFIEDNAQSNTEIDCPEIEGDKPNQLSWTSWRTTQRKEYTATQSPQDPSAGFHSYKMVWTPEQIAFYFDGVCVTTHTTVVPHVQAFAMINHWGTNSTGWGGIATPGVDRYMFVKRFSFTPAS